MYKNIFILGTGRCGTTTFIKACKHIANYSADHESQSRLIGEDRLDYPNYHIEADNRLSWFLGRLEHKFAEDTFYVHLLRDRDAVAKSTNKRWKNPSNIIDAFSRGIVMRDVKRLSEEEKLQLSYDYVDTVTSNIELMLKSTKKPFQTMYLETIKSDFKLFWEAIDAEGDLEKALAEFDVKHNPSGLKRKTTFVGRIKRAIGWN